MSGTPPEWLTIPAGEHTEDSLMAFIGRMREAAQQDNNLDGDAIASAIQTAQAELLKLQSA